MTAVPLTREQPAGDDRGLSVTFNLGYVKDTTGDEPEGAATCGI
jgi:hypothetical protein